MARVAIAGPAQVPVLSFPAVRGPRLAALVALAAGLVISVGWSATHRPLLDGMLDRVSTDFLATGWAWLRAAQANLTEQPWFGRLAETWESPIRLAVSVVLGIGIYSLGLVALRRLITPTVEGVSNANA